MLITTREIALVYLKGWGREAFARDWALGETIVIPLGKPDTHELPSGEKISTTPGILFIAPFGVDGWGIVTDKIEELHPTLDKATRRAIEFATWWEAGLEGRLAAIKFRIKQAREARTTPTKTAPCMVCGKQLPLPPWPIVEGTLKCLEHAK